MQETENKGATAFGVTAALALSIGLCSGNFKIPMLPGWLSPVAGSVIAAATLGVAKRNNLELDDLGAGVEKFQEGLKVWFPEKDLKEVQTAIVDHLPDNGIKSAAQQLLDPIQQRGDWLPSLFRSSTILAGKTNAGKTVLMQYCFFELIKRGKTVYVHNRDLGKRFGDWFGAPAAIEGQPRQGNELIFTELADLEILLKKFSDEIGRRQKVCNQRGAGREFEPMTLILCEYNVNVGELAADKQATAKIGQYLRNILLRGHGYGVFVFLEVQTLAVGETDVNLALLDQVIKVLVGDGCDSKEDLGKLKADRDHVADEVKVLRDNNLRPCVTSIPGEPVKVGIIPEIDTSLLEIQFPEADPIEVFLESIDWNSLKGQSKSNGWREIGQGKRQGSDNPYYMAYAEAWDQRFSLQHQQQSNLVTV